MLGEEHIPPLRIYLDACVDFSVELDRPALLHPLHHRL